MCVCERSRLLDRPQKAKNVVRVNSEHLAESSVCLAFSSYLQKIILRIPGEAGDKESQWLMFKASIVKMAAKS